MANSIKLLIISKFSERRQMLQNMARDENIICDSVASSTLALDKLNTFNPDIVLMLTGPSEDNAVSLCERIYFSKPKITVVVINDQVDFFVLQEFMRAGVRDVIHFPEKPEQFVNYLKTVFNNQKTHQSAMVGKEKPIETSSKVITVFGTKGGIGKTTMAVNLAAKLAEHKMRVALLDFSLELGDVNVFLDIDAADSIAELVQGQNELNMETIKKFMMLHSSGINVLTAPKSPEYADVISGEHIQKIITALKPYFDYIIIDLPTSFNDVSLTSLEMATTILYVISLEISALRNAKVGLRLLDSLQQKEKVKIIVNRESDSTITVDDIQNMLECPIIARFTSEWRDAITALNKGVPFVQCMPKSKLSLNMSRLAETMVGKKETSIGNMGRRSIRRLGK